MRLDPCGLWKVNGNIMEIWTSKSQPRRSSLRKSSTRTWSSRRSTSRIGRSSGAAPATAPPKDTPKVSARFEPSMVNCFWWWNDCFGQPLPCTLQPAIVNAKSY